MKDLLYFIGNHAVFYLLTVFAVAIVTSLIMIPLLLLKSILPRNSIFFINDFIVIFILTILLFGHLDSFTTFFNIFPSWQMYFLIAISLLIFLRQTKNLSKENPLVGWQHRNFKIRLFIVCISFCLMFLAPDIHKNLIALAIPDLFLKLSEYKAFIYFSLMAGFALIAYYVTELYGMLKADIDK